MSQVARHHPLGAVRPVSRHAERLLQALLALLIASGSLLTPITPAPAAEAAAPPRAPATIPATILHSPAAQSSSGLYVDPAGSDANDCRSPDTPCRTIHAAINKAAAGNTIHLAAGTYAENLTVDVDLSILGAGQATTIIDGGGRTGAVVGVSPGVAASLTDLTITGGDATGNGGTGVYNQGDLTLERVAVSQNHSLGGAGGAGISNSGRIEIYGGVISGNHAEGGSAGGLYSSGTTIISGTLISDNRADYYGGGILSGGSLTITGASIQGNEAPQGGGIYSSGALTATNTLVADNRARGSRASPGGGGLWVGGSATLSGVTVSGNSSAGAGGGIIVTSANARLTMRQSSVVSNTATGIGGGLYINAGATLETDESQINENIAGGSSGFFSAGTATLRNTTVRANRATDGNSGGGIGNSGTLVIERGRIEDNQATNAGGGIYTTGPVTIIESTLAGNAALGGGGAIYDGASPGIVVRDSTFSRNSADGGGAISAGKLDITGSTFSNNQARVGGALFVGGKVNLRFSTITGNVGTTNDGGISSNGLAGSTDFHIEGSIIAGNSAPSAPDFCGPLVSQGHNLIGVVSCAFTPAASDQVGTAAAPLDPSLGPLADNGGPTQTHALLPGSPAIDAAGTSCPAADQRGAARPQRAGCDIGAFELSPWSLASGDWYVAPAGSDANDCRSLDTPCRTIRSALARADNGSSLHLAAGTYAENLTVDVDLSILGAGQATTIIDGGGRAGAVVGVSPGVAARLADLTITGGDATGNGGGGVYNLGDLTLERVAVSQNHSLGGAGGIGNYGALALRNSQVISNTGTYGGMVNNGTLTVTASLIAQNTASGPGGGLANLAGASMRIESSSEISGNQAANGGGGIINSGTLRVLDSTVSNNETAANSGGGILSFGPLELSGTTVSANRAPNGNGGGIFIRNTATNSIAGSTISGNSAVAGGGIVASSGATLEIVNSTVSANTAYDGGGISSSANLTLRNTAVRDNQTIADPLLRYGSSGAGISNAGPLTIIQSQISGNHALNAGAGMYLSGTSVVSITQSTLDGNSGAMGGAIAAEARSLLTIDASTLSNNHADYVGGAICHCGGVSSIGRLTITSSTFSGNSSGPIPGGGSAIFSSSPTTIRSSTFVGNSTTGGPGAIVNQDTTGVNSFTIEGSIVADNSAPSAPDICNFITSLGNNLIGIIAATNVCAFAPAASDQVGIVAAPLDPQLGPLADNGGPTQTHDLRENSPALDAAGTTCLATDQRGAARPAGAACDIGAVESRSGFNPGFTRPDDAYSFPNAVSSLNPLAFFNDFGISATTHIISSTRVISSIEGLDALGLPITFDDTTIDAILPISITQGLTFTDTHGVETRYIPRPTAWLYEEAVVKTVYENADVGSNYQSAILGGLCAGMSATAGGFKGHVAPEFDPGRYGSVSVSAIDRAAIIDLLAKYQGRQVGAQILKHLAGPGRYTPTTLYAHLVERMRAADWWADPELIGVYKGSGCDNVEVGHALLPYRLEPQADGTARIYVYDSNYPPAAGAAELYISIDFRANTWSYLIGNNSQGDPVVWTGSDLFGTPLHLFTEPPQLPYLDGSSIIAVGGRMRGSWGGGFTTWGRMRGSWGDFDTATSTGCLLTPDGLTYVENISGSMRLRPLGGYLPQAYYFPADKTPLTITGTGGDGQTSGDMLLFGPHGVMGFTSATSPGADYSATLDADFRTLTLRTTDTPRPMTAFQMQESPDGSGTRVFAVSNLLVGADGEVSIAVSPDLSSVQVKNERNEPITFALGLANFSSAAVGSTTRTYTIEPHAIYSYTPTSWEDLAQPIMVKQIKAGTRVAAGLVSLHRFDQGTGTMIRTSGGSAQGATLWITRRRAVQWIEGGLKIAAPTSLQASRSLARLLQQLDAQGAFTLEIWVQPHGRKNRTATLIDASGSRLFATLSQTLTRTTTRFSLQMKEFVGDHWTSATLITPEIARSSEPMQIVITRDAGGLVQIYVNGELRARQQLRGPRGRAGRHGGKERSDAQGSIAHSFLSLANSRYVHRPWIGTLHMFAIYDHALSEVQVKQNYQVR